MGRSIFFLVVFIAVTTAQQQQQQGSQPQLYSPPQHQYQQPQYQQPKYQQPQYQQPQYQQPQYEQPQYQQPKYQQQQPHSAQQPQPQQWQQQPEQQQQPQQWQQQQQPQQWQQEQPQGQRQSRVDNSRPWWYAASPAGGVACKTGVSPSDRSGAGRAIKHQTPQQYPQNYNQQQQVPQEAGWKDPSQQPQQPSPYQQPPPRQDYYNVAVPANEIPNYIQTPRDQQRGPQQQQKQRHPNEPNEFDDDTDEESKPEPRYPLTPPSLKFKIGLVSDLGKDSPNEDKKKFKSFFKIGHLLLQEEGGEAEANATVEFPEDDEHHELETGINTSGEGFELSTLNYFNGKLYSCDDETGIVYELVQDEETKNYTAHPWVLLPNAEGGFKCEWATVKDDQLWVGGTGVLFPGKKPRNDTNDDEPATEDDEEEPKIHDDDYDTATSDKDSAKEASPSEKKDDKKATTTTTTTTAKTTTTTTPAPKRRSKRQAPKKSSKKTTEDDKDEFDKSRQNIKKITKDGRVIHVDWTKQYETMAEALGVNQKKGFVVHEAAAWSDIHQKWLFIPRRLSKDKYDRETYFKTGTNLGLWGDDQFNELMTVKFGEKEEITGFTDLKFIPGTDDKLILGLKSTAEDGKLFSSLSVYDWEGKEIMKDMMVGDGVYAGVEFL